MSKLIKIYDGMTFSMSTGEILEHGEVSYWEEEDLALCGGGGPSTQTTSSGFASEYKPEIKDMLGEAKGMYDSQKANGFQDMVAGFTQTGLNAQNQGTAAAGRQTGLEQSMYNNANNTGALNALQGRTGMTGSEQAIIDQARNPVDLSGQRAASLQQAQGALGTSNAMAGQSGGLGGSRQSINQSSIEQGLAANFAGIDQQAQQMQDQRMSNAVNAEQGQFGRLQTGFQAQGQQLNNMGAAAGIQGQGAQTLGMIGQAQQAQNQAQADSPYTALAQRIGLFSGVAGKEQNTEKTGGK